MYRVQGLFLCARDTKKLPQCTANEVFEINNVLTVDATDITIITIIIIIIDSK